MLPDIRAYFSVFRRYFFALPTEFWRFLMVKYKVLVDQNFQSNLYQASRKQSNGCEILESRDFSRIAETIKYSSKPRNSRLLSDSNKISEKLIWVIVKIFLNHLFDGIGFEN
jgi:hypothetical protein